MKDTSSVSNGSIDLGPVRSRFRTVRDALRAVFREREDAIECMILAALSGSHALLLMASPIRRFLPLTS